MNDARRIAARPGLVRQDGQPIWLYTGAIEHVGGMMATTCRARRRVRLATSIAASLVVAGIGAVGPIAPAVAAPVPVAETCTGSGVAALPGGLAQINNVVVQQLQTVPFVLTLPTDVTATPVVGAGGRINYQVPIAFDLQAIVNDILVTIVKPSIALAAPGTGVENQAFLEVTAANLSTDIPVPAGTAINGVPAGSSSPPGAPAVMASLVAGNTRVRGSIAGPLATGSYQSPAPTVRLPPRAPFTANVAFAVDVTGVAVGSTVLLRPGPAAFDLTFRVGLGDGTLFGGATGNMACTSDPSLVVATTLVTIPPAPPTGVTGLRGNQEVTVSWVAPPSMAPITGYTVTANPGPARCTTTGALVCAVRGLTNGTPYTFTVTATNGAGTGSPSAPSAAVTPGPPPRSRFTGVTPKRIFDSRDGTGTALGPFTAGQTRDAVVTGGATTVPAAATAVVLNLTATNNTAATHLTVWPSGGVRPDASSLNLPLGATRPNLVTAAVGNNNSISVFNNSGTTQVIADVVGYYSLDATGGLYHPVTPKRILDSRDGTGTPAGPFTGAQTRSFAATGGTTSVPVGATAVMLNVTGANATAGTHLTVWPAGVTKPDASNLNVFQGVDSANLVAAKVGVGPDAGMLSVFNNQGSSHVIADVVGYFSAPTGADPPLGQAPGEFSSLAPNRVIDSRSGTGTPQTRWASGETRQVTVTGGATTVPAGVTAVAVNLTAVLPTASTHITVFAAGVAKPDASNLNLPVDDVRANLVIVGIDAQGRINLFNNAGQLDLILDVVGYFSA